MLLGVTVHAGFELRFLIAVAGAALDLRRLVGMRVVLDVGVTVVALKCAVHALAELVAIDADLVAVAVGHALVSVAGEAVGLRAELRCGYPKQHHGRAEDCNARDDACAFLREAEEASKGTFVIWWNLERSERPGASRHSK
jgi:hypothetical protein